jgi:hypothetical protein
MRKEEHSHSRRSGEWQRKGHHKVTAPMRNVGVDAFDERLIRISNKKHFSVFMFGISADRMHSKRMYEKKPAIRIQRVHCVRCQTFFASDTNSQGSLGQNGDDLQSDKS